MVREHERLEGGGGLHRLRAHVTVHGIGQRQGVEIAEREARVPAEVLHDLGERLAGIRVQRFDGDLVIIARDDEALTIDRVEAWIGQGHAIDAVLQCERHRIEAEEISTDQRRVADVDPIGTPHVAHAVAGIVGKIAGAAERRGPAMVEGIEVDGVEVAADGPVSPQHQYDHIALAVIGNPMLHRCELARLVIGDERVRVGVDESDAVVGAPDRDHLMGRDVEATEALTREEIRPRYRTRVCGLKYRVWFPG